MLLLSNNLIVRRCVAIGADAPLLCKFAVSGGNHRNRWFFVPEDLYVQVGTR